MATTLKRPREGPVCYCEPPIGSVRCPFTGYVDVAEWGEAKHNAGWTQTKCDHGLWVFWWPPDRGKP